MATDVMRKIRIRANCGIAGDRFQVAPGQEFDWREDEARRWIENGICTEVESAMTGPREAAVHQNPKARV